MVRKGGFEPPRSCERQPLKTLRLGLLTILFTGRGWRCYERWKTPCGDINVTGDTVPFGLQDVERQQSGVSSDAHASPKRLLPS
jgi:hypothetical protein